MIVSVIVVMRSQGVCSCLVVCYVAIAFWCLNDIFVGVPPLQFYELGYPIYKWVKLLLFLIYLISHMPQTGVARRKPGPSTGSVTRPLVTMAMISSRY